MKKTFIWPLAIFIVLAAATFFFIKQANNTPTNLPTYSPSYDWRLSFEFSPEEIIETDFSSSVPLSLFQITQDIAHREAWDFDYQDYGTMGILVNQIKDKESGQEQKYWQYFVGDIQPQISADQYFPDNETHITWKFQTSDY